MISNNPNKSKHEDRSDTTC